MKRKMKPLFSAVRKWLFGDTLKAGFAPVVCPPGMQPTPCQQQQAGHTDAAAYSESSYYISATLPDSYDEAGYESTDLVWAEIGQVVKFPAYGSMQEINKISPIKGAIKKVKRTADYGGGDMQVVDLPQDAGQIIAKAASASSNHYSIKVVYADGETHYLDVIVAGWQKTEAASGEFMLRTAKVEVNKAPVEVAAA